MDLYEYQARDLFEAHGVPVLGGIVARTPAEARAAAEQLGGGLVVVKAQVKVGGRGKAGGVKLAEPPTRRPQTAERDPRHGHQGPHRLQAVMVAEGADIAEEYYFSILLDRANRAYLAMCSVEGGMEIEQLAASAPTRWRCPRSMRTGLDEKAHEIVAEAGFPAEIAAAQVDARPGEAVEVYAARRTRRWSRSTRWCSPHGRGCSPSTARSPLDENADFRHASHAELRRSTATDPARAAGQGSSTSTTSSSTARSASSATAPGS
jgi:succinyl-CoA synthetase beta subunit